MKTAIISDVHGNLEALQVVLDDIKSRGVSEIISLGDTIGYGPNPRECLKIVQENSKFSLRGNHEDAILYIGLHFHKEAAMAVNWTRDELNSFHHNRDETEKLWDYLGDLPQTKEIDGHIYVHGSPRSPINEYLYPNDIIKHSKIQENFKLTQHICFCGHTHEPGIFVQDTDKTVYFYSPHQVQDKHELNTNKCIVNVGSVGQPRDFDNRACYIIVNDELITFHRVSYDYKETMKKILETRVLPKILAARLQVGR